MTDAALPRVLMVSSLWPPHVLGGAEVYAANLAEHLREAGHEVGAVTLGVPGPDVVAEVPPLPYRLDHFASQPAWRRAEFHALDLYRRATRRVMIEAFERFRPDVVHTHSVQGLSSLALETPSVRGIAHVHTLHDYWLLCQRASLVKRDGSACDRRCRSCVAISGARNRRIGRHHPNVVVAVSDAIAEEHRGIPWIRPRLRVIWNPTDVAAGSRSAPRQPPTFGYLGQITAAKGVATLIEAFAGADLPGARLIIAGDGAARGSLEASPVPGVEFRGWLHAAQKEAFFTEIDCLVVPSEWKDPAPLVLNEARARRVPVIGARIGGIPELLAPASEPLLFRSGNVADLALRLVEFTASPDRYSDAGEIHLPGWAEHLVAIQHVYDAARAAASEATERRA